MEKPRKCLIDVEDLFEMLKIDTGKSAYTVTILSKDICREKDGRWRMLRFNLEERQISLAPGLANKIHSSHAFADCKIHKRVALQSSIVV